MAYWIYFVFLLPTVICELEYLRAMRGVLDGLWTDENFDKYFTNSTRFSWCEKQSYVGHCFDDLKGFLNHSGKSNEYPLTQRVTLRVLTNEMAGMEYMISDPAHEHAKQAIKMMKRVFQDMRSILENATELTSNKKFKRYCDAFMELEEKFKEPTICHEDWNTRGTQEVLAHLHEWSKSKVWILYHYYERCLIEQAAMNARLTCLRAKHIATNQVRASLEEIKAELIKRRQPPISHNQKIEIVYIAPNRPWLRRPNQPEPPDIMTRKPLIIHQEPTTMQQLLDHRKHSHSTAANSSTKMTRIIPTSTLTTKPVSAKRPWLPTRTPPHMHHGQRIPSKSQKIKLQLTTNPTPKPTILPIPFESVGSSSRKIVEPTNTLPSACNDCSNDSMNDSLGSENLNTEDEVMAEFDKERDRQPEMIELEPETIISQMESNQVALESSINSSLLLKPSTHTNENPEAHGKHRHPRPHHPHTGSHPYQPLPDGPSGGRKKANPHLDYPDISGISSRSSNNSKIMPVNVIINPNYVQHNAKHVHYEYYPPADSAGKRPPVYPADDALALIPYAYDDNQSELLVPNNSAHFRSRHVVIGPMVIVVLIAIILLGFITFLVRSIKPCGGSPKPLPPKPKQPPGSPPQSPQPPQFTTGNTAVQSVWPNFPPIPTTTDQAAIAPNATQNIAQPPAMPSTSETTEVSAVVKQRVLLSPKRATCSPPCKQQKSSNQNANSCGAVRRTVSNESGEASGSLLERMQSNLESVISASDESIMKTGSEDASSHTLEKWFNPNISATDAHDLLVYRGRDGSFLIRSCQTHSETNNYILCVKKGTQVITFKIQMIDDAYEFCGEKFSTLKKLIDYYKQHLSEFEELVGVPVELKHPMAYDSLPDGRCYHPNINREGADELLMLQAMDGCYLLRPCQTEPGHYYLSFKRNNKVLHKKIHNMGDYYSIDQDKFKNLLSLIRRYSELEVPVNCFDPSPASYPPRSPTRSQDFNLKEQKLDTSFTAISISQKIRELSKLFFNSGKSGFMVEFEQLKYYDDAPHSTEIARLPRNISKNRFANILPYDHNRIVLLKDEGEDYINASKIVIPSAIFDGKTYIASQGPMTQTVADFWLMAWQEECRIIIMACDLVEQGKLKCEKYWPSEREEKTVIISPTAKITILNEGITEKQDFSIREFTVTYMTETQCSTRTLWHYQYMAWPHFTIPKFPGSVNRFMREVNARYQRIGAASPLLIHCSDGAGRTGAIIIMDIIMGQINKHGKECYIDILQLVRVLRRQRPLMVQTPEQFRFIYLATQSYIGWYLQQIQQVKKQPRARPLPIDDVDPFDSEVRPVPPSVYQKLSQNSVAMSLTSRGSTTSTQSNSPQESVVKYQPTPCSHPVMDIPAPFATSTPSSQTGTPVRQGPGDPSHGSDTPLTYQPTSHRIGGMPTQPVTPIPLAPGQLSRNSDTPTIMEQVSSRRLNYAHPPMMPIHLSSEEPFQSSEMSVIFEETSSLEPSTTHSISLTSDIMTPEKFSQSAEMPPIYEQSTSMDQSSIAYSTYDGGYSQSDTSTEQSPIRRH